MTKKNDELPEKTKIGNQDFVLCKECKIYYPEPKEKREERQPGEFPIFVSDCPLCFRKTVSHMLSRPQPPTCSMIPGDHKRKPIGRIKKKDAMIWVEKTRR